MFESLLGGKFSNKCKHGVKCIRSRIGLIRRKKHAMLKYLRRDVAELLSNGHDTNAFGRIEALIFEINHASCYDLIELYCECILQLLPSLQKQRECPKEAMEAMSTLIFAAARFSDLPELCDLRTLFTERYGSEMESSINGEFVEKMQKKSFSMEKKLQLMQHIAEEFSVPWDSKAFQQKLYNQQRLHAENWRKAAVKGRKESVINVGGDREAPTKERREPPPRNHVQKKQVQPEHRDFQYKVRSENNDQHSHAENWRNATIKGRKEAAINAGKDREAPSKERWEPPPSNHVQKEQVQPEHQDVQYKLRRENNDQHSYAENWRNTAIKGRKEAAINADGDREAPSKERWEPPPSNFLQKELVQPEPRDPHSKLRSEIDDQRSHAENWRNKGRKDAAIYAGGDRELPSNGRWQPPPPPMSLVQKEQVQPEPRDIHVISSISNGRRHDPAERNRNQVHAAVEGPENLQRGYTDAKVFPPVKPKGSQNGSHKDGHFNKSPMAREEPGLIGLENAKILASNKPKGRRNGTHKDAYLNEGAADCRSPMAREGPGLIGLEKPIVGQVISRDVKAVNMIPPHTKLNGIKNEIHARDDELPKAEEKMDPIAQESWRPPKTPKSSDARLINMLPPYTRLNIKSPSTSDDYDIKITNVPIDGSNHADNDMSSGGERPKPFSVRRKHPKIPVVIENEDLVRKEGRRDDDLHGEVKVVDRQLRQAGNAEEASMKQQPRQATAEELGGGVICDQHASRPRRERRKHGSRSAAAYDRERDEEEQAMDRLLVHFSKKGTSRSRTRTRAPPAELLVDTDRAGEHQHHHHNGNGRVYPGPTEPVIRRPDRISSLLSEPTTPVPEAGAGKGPARATSMQPHMMRLGEGLVHPRLPDYDELAARFIALKKT